MSVETTQDFERLQAIGRIVALVLKALTEKVRPGITTAELDEAGARLLASHGAQAAPPIVYGFPGALCISVNDEAIHGIPGTRTVQAGDLVKLDLVAEKDGYFADAAVTVPVPPVTTLAMRLTACAKQAFQNAMDVARAGRRVHDIGRAVEQHVRRNGFRVIRELAGHGVGRTIHEPPCVPNYPDRRATDLLTQGLVITVEPIIAAGSGRVVLEDDGWTVRTGDGSFSAHYEHTIVIGRGRPILLTAL
jgi:methionyl aminopeptidase